ncbi:MAG TPA: EAL domain-containing protein [Acidimicrobiales bacterium]|nr:EAL domain-containing protein [Acidimicrobiales bacterium]
MTAGDALFAPLPADDAGCTTIVVGRDGRILSLGPEAERLFGCDAADLVGQPIERVVRGVPSGVLAPLLARAAAGKPVVGYPTVHLRPDGSTHEVEVHASPLLDASGGVTGMVIVLRELAAQRRMETELAIASTRLEGLLEASGALAWEVDLSGHEPVWWAGGDWSSVGLKGAMDASGRISLDLVHPRDRARLLDLATAALDGSNRASTTHRMVLQDGTVRWLAVSAIVLDEQDGVPLRIRGVALDVTDQHRALDRVRLLGERSSDLVIRYRIGGDSDIEYISPSCVHFTGYTDQEIYEGGMDLLLTTVEPPIIDQLRADYDDEALSDKPYEYRSMRRDGSYVWARATFRQRDDDGHRILEISIRDISRAKELEMEVSKLLLTDPLTGLASRRALEEHWSRLHGLEVTGGWAALAHVDIDRFGLVNAGLGIAAGDEMLRVVGRRLGDELARSVIVARLGGDDFVVLATSLHSRSEAFSVAGRLVGAMAEPMLIGGRDVYATVSVGATVVPPGAAGGGGDLHVHLAEAHVAMRAAKARGGGCSEVFEEGMRTKAQDKIETLSALRHGMADGQFILHYQPIVDLRSAEIVGAEALVRWEHPARGLLLPSEFIALAEETGSIVPLGAWVVEQACEEAAAWPVEGRDIRIAVNLSARQLGSPDLIGRVAEALDRCGLAPDRLVLEITETSVIHDLDRASWTLRRLGDMGVHFALDDFGTGYSSLAYLVQLPIDRVKVDRSMVAGLPLNPHSQAVVAGVVGMAEALGIAAIAEGVETEEQLAALNDLGCHLAQGFFFSPPVSAEDFAKLVIVAPTWRWG